MEAISYSNFHINKAPYVTDNNSTALSFKNCTQRMAS